MMSKKSLKMNNQFPPTKSVFNKFASPGIDINNSEFKRLTAAEQLNNSKYRSLVYRTYPNEPTCGCKSTITEQSTNISNIDKHKFNANFLVCPGGCKKSCCSRKMHSRVAKNQDNGNYDKVIHIISTYSIENQPSNKVYNRMYCVDERMRGGGSVEKENCECSNWGLTEYSKNIENTNRQSERFRDTSNYDGNGFDELKTRFFSSKFSHQTQVPKSNNYQFTPVSDCTCLENKEAFKFLENHKKICVEQKYIPIKCLTREVEEAQKFFDSFDEALDPPELNMIDSSKTLHYGADEKQKKLVEMSRTFSLQSSIVDSQINSTPFIIAVPGEGGIVQEAIIPGAYKHDNYEIGEWSEDVKIGPCRKLMCKARRKKTDHERSSTTANTEIKSNTSREKESNNKRKKKQYKSRGKERQIISSSLDNFRSKKKLKKIRYVYSRGDTYPGFFYGHKNCNNRLKKVPPNMGWFWTQYEAAGKMKPRVGWKPGAISRQIREIIKQVKDGLIEKKSKSSLILSTDMQVKKSKIKSASSLKKGHSKKLKEKEDHELPPTLHVQRKKGVYYVTMYPIKKKETDIPQLDEPGKPFQFKINTKKNNSSVATNSTNSDMEIEFSPPTAVNRYRRKPDVVHVGTQVKHQEIINAFKPDDDKRKENKGKKKKQIRERNK